jgi:hypothetical protein
MAKIKYKPGKLQLWPPGGMGLKELILWSLAGVGAWKLIKGCKCNG